MLSRKYKLSQIMAIANPTLVQAIRAAAKKIKQGSDYEWGHMGKCNCGHLAQQLTKLSKAEIHNYAMLKSGDWSEQVLDYCPTSGLLMDQLISTMLDAGLDRTDLMELEKLSSLSVLQNIPKERGYLNFNVKEDVTLYMETWAKQLEEDILKKIEISELSLLDSEAVH